MAKKTTRKTDKEVPQKKSATIKARPRKKPEAEKPAPTSSRQLASIADITKTPTKIIGMLYRKTPRAVGLWHSDCGCPRNDDGKTYNLKDVIEWHESWKINAIEQQNAIDAESSQERLRSIKADREQIRLDHDRGRLIPREDVHQALGRLATILRGAGETLGRQFGPDAQGILDEALVDFNAESQNSFGKLDEQS